MPTDWSQTFLYAFEAYFLPKVHENWMNVYWSENTSNDIFHFSVSVIELEFSADRFSRTPLFSHFYPKIDADAHFKSVFLNIGWYKKKPGKYSSIFHSKNKNIYNFNVFTIKTDVRNRSENKRFRRKTEQNCLEVPTLPLFLQKTLYLLKSEKH